MEHSQALDSSLPVIDIHPLIAGTAARDRVAKQIGQVCREYGFFYIIGHGVDEELQQRLERLSCQFFAQAIERKIEIRIALTENRQICQRQDSIRDRGIMPLILFRCSSHNAGGSTAKSNSVTSGGTVSSRIAATIFGARVVRLTMRHT